MAELTNANRAPQLLGRTIKRVAYTLSAETFDAPALVEHLVAAQSAGFGFVYIHQIGPRQREAIEFFASEVLPVTVGARALAVSGP